MMENDKSLYIVDNLSVFSTELGVKTDQEVKTKNVQLQKY
jgi:hypothetical protein